MALSNIGTAHVVAATLGLLSGAIQLTRTRRDATHRRIGYVYVSAMAISNVTALLVYRFTGGFNIFHALAIYNLFNVSMALRPMLANPRPWQWRRQHYMWVAYSYAGLSAAALTEFLVRVMGMDGWLGAAVGTPPVILIGAVLIHHFAPPLRPPAPA